MPYRTLEDLRAELRIRLGFGAAGGVPGVLQPLLNSFLRQAQEELYWNGAWADIRKRADLTIGVGQTLVNYPADANKQRIEAIYALVTNTWQPVTEGIDKALYTTVATQNFPSFYERLDQLEFWPQADQTYTLRVWYYKELDRFTQDADRATINDGIIFSRALAIGKAHYRHPDAESVNTIAGAMISGAKGGAWSRKVWKPTKGVDVPLAKPRTV